MLGCSSSGAKFIRSIGTDAFPRRIIWIRSMVLNQREALRSL